MPLLTDPVALVGVVAFALLILGLDAYRRRQPPQQTILFTSEKRNVAEERPLGEWVPEEFDYPPFEPDTTFDIKITPTPGYRPFRWGPNYFINMGIRSMPWDDWIQLDKQLPAYHAIKAHRTATMGEDCVHILPARPGIPSGDLAAKELVYELAEWLSRRYPTVYRVTRKPHVLGDFGWYRQGQIHTVEMVPLGVTYDLDTEDSMKVAGLLVEDDLALMLEGSDGRYYFQAGSICLAGFWRMRDKIGLPLEEIHTNGKVPQYKEKLHHSMARFFRKMKPSGPVIRNNYFYQIIDPRLAALPSEDPRSLDPEELAWSDTTNGPETVYSDTLRGPDPNHPSFASSAAQSFKPPQPTTDVSTIRFRTERQSLRRLPRSGAIVFTIRTYIESIVDMCEEPGVPGRMASAIRSWGEDVAFYKGQILYRDAILPYLDERHQEQVQKGLVQETDRASQYPF